MKNINKRLKTEATPLIDGETATFVWKGQAPPDLRGDFSNWVGVPAENWQRGPKGYWTYQHEFPADAYLEYCFGPDGARQLDPFNSRLTPNGMGYKNHFFYMPDGRPSEWAVTGRSVPRGTVSRHRLATEGMISRRRRTVYLYQPPVAGPLPLLLVYDGRDYRRRAKLTTVVDNLIAAGRMAPVALALLPNAGTGRMAEYACSEGMLLFLLHRLLPLAESELDLLPLAENPGAYGVMGTSMGGLMALFTGLRLSHIFGQVYSQSGAFEFGPYQSLVFDLLAARTRPDLQLYLDVGQFEWLLEPNRHMRAALHNAGYTFSYHEFNAGHNYPAWRDNLHRGLSRLFPAAPEPEAVAGAADKRAVNIWGKEFRKV